MTLLCAALALRAGIARAGDPPPPPTVERDALAEGTVFHDADGNGRLDPGDKPLAGVQVNDGERVFITGADGRYSFRLRVDGNRFIHVTKPTGWRTSGAFFRRIDPAEDSTRYTFDFPVLPDPPSRSPDFNFLVTADSQFRTAEEGLMLKEEFAQITQQRGNPAFFVINGDLTMSGYVREMQWYIAAAAEMRIPSYHVFGGHDGNYARGKGYPGTGHFEEMIGPVTFSWNWGGRHFVAFVAETSYMPPAARERQRKWLEADAGAQPQGTEFLSCSHYPPGAELIDLWSARGRVRACFYGHWHELNVYEYRGIPHVDTAPLRGLDWGALTRAYRIVRFRDGDLSGEMRWTGQYKRLVIVNPPEGERLGRGKVPVHVVAYDSASRVESVAVSLRPARAKREALRLELKSDDRRAWTWRGILDTRALPRGACVMKAVARDETGASWSREGEFEIREGVLKPPAPKGDWLSIFRDGVSSRALPGELRPPLRLAWSVPTGGKGVLGAAPVIRRGVIYLGVQDDEIHWPAAGVAAFDARSGRQIWRTRVDSSVKNAPALDGDALFVVSAQGYVYRLDSSTGRIVWKSCIYEQPEIATHHVVKGGVTVGNGRAVVQDDAGSAAILDAATGRVLHRLGGFGQSYYATPSLRDGVAYVCGRYMTGAVDVLTGAVLWKTKTTNTRGLSAPVPLSDRVYLNARLFHVFDAESGAIVWTAPVSGGAWGMLTPVVGGDLVLAGGSTLSALERSSGAKVWDLAAGSHAVSFENNMRQTLGGMAAPVLAGQVCYWASDDGFLYAIDVKTGKELWRYFLGVPLKASPIISGNTLYLVDFDGNLCAFTSTTGM